jgi:hypothetical protein
VTFLISTAHRQLPFTSVTFFLNTPHTCNCFLLGQEKNGHSTILLLEVSAVVHNSATTRPIHEIIDCTMYTPFSILKVTHVYQLCHTQKKHAITVTLKCKHTNWKLIPHIIKFTYTVQISCNRKTDGWRRDFMKAQAVHTLISLFRVVSNFGKL